jgi:hypothetical protein
MKQGIGSWVLYAFGALVLWVVVDAAAKKVREVAAQDPNCDQGCQDRWENATRFVLPLLVARRFQA